MTIAKPFSVQTFDAYESPPYSGDPLNVGSFSTADAALECAKKVVDDQLRISIESGLSVEDALLSFSTAGEIPMILVKVKFICNHLSTLKCEHLR